MQAVMGRAVSIAALAVLAVLVGILVVSRLPAQSGASVSEVPTLAPERYELRNLTDAVDVTDNPGASLPGSRVSMEDAIQIVLEDSGRTDTDVRVLRGMAERAPGERPRDVWVVLLKADYYMSVGPPGEEVRQYVSLNGAMVDAETGEIWYTFLA